MMTCSAPRAQKFRYDGMMKLRTALDGTQGGSAILRAIKAWTTDPHAAPSITANTLAYDDAIRRATASQNEIGWDNALRGFVSV